MKNLFTYSKFAFIFLQTLCLRMSQQAEVLPWMNENYFKSVLTKSQGDDNLCLQAFNITSGANKGEGFTSAIYRVKLNYLLRGEAKETTLILKTSSQIEAITGLLDELGTFEAETQVYEKVLAECYKLFPSFKIAPRQVHFTPKILRYLSCILLHLPISPTD